MKITMKYRKKPVEIEVVRIPQPFHDKICDTLIERDRKKAAGTPLEPLELGEGFTPTFLVFINTDGGRRVGEKDHTLYVLTNGGKSEVSPGDYIVKGVKGEYYPIDPDTMKETYDPVDAHKLVESSDDIKEIVEYLRQYKNLGRVRMHFLKSIFAHSVEMVEVHVNQASKYETDQIAKDGE